MLLLAFETAASPLNRTSDNIWALGQGNQFAAGLNKAGQNGMVIRRAGGQPVEMKYSGKPIASPFRQDGLLIVPVAKVLRPFRSRAAIMEGVECAGHFLGRHGSACAHPGHCFHEKFKLAFIR